MATSHPGNLWKFLPINEVWGGQLDGIGGKANAAPDLIPLNNFDPASPEPNLINVINDFEWTHTPAEGRHEVPVIRLSEYRLRNSPVLTNLKYHLSIAADQVTQMAGALKGSNNTDATYTAIAQRWARQYPKKGGYDAKYVKESIKTNKKYGDKTATDFLTKDEKRTLAADKKKGMIEKTFEGGMSAMQGIAGLVNKGVGVEVPNNIPHYLRPYYGLYDLLPTGFEYTFPYFDGMWKDKSSSWANAQGGGLLQGLIGEATKFLREDVAKSLEMIPGTKGAYIEQPKMYNFEGGSGPSRTFKFSLINTNNFADVVKNWQLIFLLLYQQLPNRENKVRVEPPVIYEVEIPGVFYTPYAYIGNISVQNRGAVRKMNIPVLYDAGIRDTLNIPGKPEDRSQPTWNNRINYTLPRYNRSNNDTHKQSTVQKDRQVQGKQQGNTAGSSDPKTEYIETIIPDAWDVTIRVESLIPEAKNLAFHSTLGPATRASGLYSVSVSEAGGHIAQAQAAAAEQRKAYENR